ncbi:TPA: DUF551 domain-containing protein [Escherichia coli]|uniref:DUF551 domain-containing protein n=1 Tax=Escherichia coli TaxID=562 RepID=UPI001802DF8C|nr:DUF551 domain-containing protein [Escherichia coli]EFC3031855.1 DUF551 domain-containing protein [Escherichia coli]EJI9156293.1 ead/Ea22-like family protein [Escherichia coli]ELV4095605.1 ead/Ea22-like family protein [Escherichia coli]
MSKIDYQKLREIAEKTKIAGETPVMPFDQRINALNDFMKRFSPDIALALLDERERNQQYIKLRDQENEDIALTVGKLRVELEAAEKRIAELESLMVPQLPQQAVPDEIPEPDTARMFFTDAVVAIAKVQGWNACRAAMLQAEPVSNSDELPLDYLQGHKDGLEWAAQQAEANHPQTGDWLYDDPIDLARAIRKGPDMPTVQGGNSPVTPDGWISCSERMPDTKTAVLVAVEFDRKGDWRMKWATYIPGHPDANDGWIIPGASWKPSHWMPLPEPPQEAK